MYHARLMDNWAGCPHSHWASATHPKLWSRYRGIRDELCKGNRAFLLPGWEMPQMTTQMPLPSRVQELLEQLRGF
jgi:hypothetical protein